MGQHRAGSRSPCRVVIIQQPVIAESRQLGICWVCGQASFDPQSCVDRHYHQANTPFSFDQNGDIKNDTPPPGHRSEQLFLATCQFMYLDIPIGTHYTIKQAIEAYRSEHHAQMEVMRTTHSTAPFWRGISSFDTNFAHILFWPGRDRLVARWRAIIEELRASIAPVRSEVII